MRLGGKAVPCHGDRLRRPAEVLVPHSFQQHGVVIKTGMTEYVVQLQVRDARSGEVVSKYSTGLRTGANSSPSRGVCYLMKNAVLATQ